MLAVERAGAPARHRRRGAAGRAVVQPLPLHRLPEHHHGGARRRRRHASRRSFADDARLSDASARGGTEEFSAIRSRASRTGRWSPAMASTPATSRFPISCTCASCARAHAHARIVSIDTAAARAHAGRGRGVDRGRHRRPAADRFSRSLGRGAQALSPAGAGARPRALRRRSGGGGVRRGSLCGGRRRRAGRRSRSSRCRC